MTTKPKSGDVERLAANYAMLEVRLTRARSQLYDAIRDAAAGGIMQAELARQAGLTRQRIGQILSERKEAA